jgi:hypothetical protein
MGIAWTLPPLLIVASVPLASVGVIVAVGSGVFPLATGVSVGGTVGTRVGVRVGVAALAVVA